MYAVFCIGIRGLLGRSFHCSGGFPPERGPYMKLTTVLFDLDGTLLPMDQEKFTKGYFGLLTAKLAPLGYEPRRVIDGVWAGTAAMVENNGSRTNEAVFWDKFAQLFGQEALSDRPVFDAFYANEFQAAQQFCGCNPQAARTVRAMRNAGSRVVLATNPIFPAAGTRVRLGWTGLTPADFELCTTYENCRWCKPSLGYYQEILDTLGLRAEECLMVGNDAEEDMAARELGMEVFLLTDCLINRQGKELSAYPQGSFGELLEYWEQLREGST